MTESDVQWKLEVEKRLAAAEPDCFGIKCSQDDTELCQPCWDYYRNSAAHARTDLERALRVIEGLERAKEKLDTEAKYQANRCRIYNEQFLADKDEKARLTKALECAKGVLDLIEQVKWSAVVKAKRAAVTEIARIEKECKAIK